MIGRSPRTADAIGLGRNGPLQRLQPQAFVTGAPDVDACLRIGSLLELLEDFSRRAKHERVSTPYLAAFRAP